MPLLWDSLQIQPQTVPFCLFATPVRGSLKSPYTVGVAVRCEPRRRSSATPPLIPAIIIGRRLPIDLDAYFFCAHLRPKPPKLRFNAIGRNRKPTLPTKPQQRAKSWLTAGYFHWLSFCLFLLSFCPPASESSTRYRTNRFPLPRDRAPTAYLLPVS